AVCELASGTDGDSRALMTTKSAARATIDMALISYKIFNWVEILGPTLWSCCAADCSTKIQACQFNSVTQSSTRLTVADKWQLIALIANYMITNILLLS